MHATCSQAIGAASTRSSHRFQEDINPTKKTQQELLGTSVALPVLQLQIPGEWESTAGWQPWTCAGQGVGRSGVTKCSSPSARTRLRLQPTTTFAQVIANRKVLMCKAHAWPVAHVREGQPSQGWVQDFQCNALCAYSQERRQLPAPGSRAAIH